MTSLDHDDFTYKILIINYLLRSYSNRRGAYRWGKRVEYSANPIDCYCNRYNLKGRTFAGTGRIKPTTNKPLHGSADLSAKTQ